MSLKSRTYKEIPKTPMNVFWIETLGDREDFRDLSKKFDEIPTVIQEGKLAYPPLAMALPPYGLYFQIVGTAASLVTIANILSQHLRARD